MVSLARRQAGPTPTIDRWWPAAGVVAGMLVACWQVRGLWGPGLPAGEDVTANLVRLDFAIPHLVAAGRLDGWLPRFYVGYQEFLFNGPGLAWTCAGLRAVTLGRLSDVGALELVGAGAYVATPAGVAFLARSLGLDRRAAGVAAVLALVVSSPYGVGLAGLYVTGLVAQQLAVPATLLALGAVARLLERPQPRWVFLAAGAGVAVGVTHAISALVLGLLVAILVGWRTLLRRASACGLARLALAGVLAAGLAGWWLVPALAHRDLRGIVATWDTPSLWTRLGEILDGRLLVAPLTAWLLLAAIAYGTFCAARHDADAATPIVLAVVYLVVAHTVEALDPGGEIAVQLANRGLGLVGVLLVCPLALAVTDLGRGIERGHPRRAPGVAAATLAACALAVASPLGPDDALARDVAPPRPELDRAADELASRVPDGARFATVSEFPAEITHTGVVHPARWLAWRSGRASLNGWNLESSSTPGLATLPDRLAVLPPEGAADELGMAGVTHVVTTGASVRERLLRSARFGEVWHEGAIAIFEVHGPPGAPAPASLVTLDGPGSAVLGAAEPERWSLRIRTPRATATTVALAWSPKWHATVDGRPVDTRRDERGLLVLDVGAGTSEIILTYRHDGWDVTGLAATVATSTGVVAWVMARGRRRHSTSRSFSRIA